MSILQYKNSPTRCTTTYVGPNLYNNLTIAMATTKVECPVELWQAVPGTNGSYEASTHGNIRSHNFSNRGVTKQLAMNLDNYGYPRVCVCIDGKKRPVRVHRLVALTFLKPVSGKTCVNHIDADKTNNRVENLEWVTLGENNRHAAAMGLSRGTFGQGENHSQAKLTADQVTEMRERFKTGIYSIKEFAAIYGLQEHHMGSIIRGRCWKSLPL